LGGAFPVFAQDVVKDPGQDDGASILMYHRFGEDDIPSTNITLDQIDAHIKELISGGYTALSLPDIVGRLKAGERFPPKSYGVSIDDAYLSVYTEAWPRFKKAGIPFTVFVATDYIDAHYARYMSWDQIREMAADPLVTIGSQTASHPHMIDADTASNLADLDKSNGRFHAELGFVPNLIAYPYGEFDDNVVVAAKQSGFVAGFGQHSGSFGPSSDIFRLPRFAMNETYGDVSRLRTAASALPMKVRDFTPSDTVVSKDNNPPAVGFTLPDDLTESDQIACYSNQEGKLEIERLGPRVEVRMANALPTGRTRLNCTLPFTDANGETRWRWLGRLFYVK
jgi:peptidoglycan/xylan/chitin deacetylase (PgdA/CDA1 family)